MFTAIDPTELSRRQRTWLKERLADRQAEAASAAERADAATEAALMKAKESERQKRLAEKKLVRFIHLEALPYLDVAKGSPGIDRLS